MPLNRCHQLMSDDKKTILVAVNDLFFYTKVRDALLPQSYTLERARTQEDFSTKVRSAPCAVILDMNDGKLDALQALGLMNAHPSPTSIPSLAFANHEEVDTWKRAKELGVTKIVSRNEFSSRTRALVDEVLASGHRIEDSP